MTDNAGMADEKWFDRARRGLRNAGVQWQDIATATGVTPSAVGHWLSGRREPSVEELRTIAKMAGLSLDEMCGDDPRFLTTALDKALFDATRGLTDDQKRMLLAAAESITKPQTR